MQKNSEIKRYSQRYKNDASGWRYLAYAALCFFMMWLALLSCSLSKKTDKAYKGIEKYQPLKPKDTSRLATRFKSTFPPQPPKIVEGKTITKIVAVQDAAKVKELQDKIDSLIDEANVSKELLASVPKIDSLKAAIRKQVLKECKPTQTVIENYRVDTLFQDKPETIAALWLAKNNEKELTALNEEKTVKLAEYKAKTGSLKWTFLHLFSFWYLDVILVLLLVVFFYLKRFKII